MSEMAKWTRNNLSL